MTLELMIGTFVLIALLIAGFLWVRSNNLLQQKHYEEAVDLIDVDNRSIQEALSVDQKTIRILYDNGVDVVEDLFYYDKDDLMALEGIGEVRAERILEAVEQLRP